MDFINKNISSFFYYCFFIVLFLIVGYLFIKLIPLLLLLIGGIYLFKFFKKRNIKGKDNLYSNIKVDKAENKQTFHNVKGKVIDVEYKEVD